ncbi:MAG: 4Fe-4S binding protein [Syntrophorhabdaceae bacterium]|nr:4Fe-4S binding protein [Syntrophorhabdaceae bacterium]
MIPEIDIERCTGCSQCTHVCPAQALSMEKDTVKLEEEYCEECGLCADVCPCSAIKIPFPVLDVL